MSFGSIAADYDRLRSGPADEAIGWMLPSGCETVVDVAAGTGLQSRMISRKVPRVVAVEPDGRMAAYLRSRSPGVAVLRGVGEAVALATGSADAVLISSAWHWLDLARAVPELARVLRDGGRLGVSGTGVNSDVGWVIELERLVYGPEEDRGWSRDGRPRRNRSIGGDLPGADLGDGHPFVDIASAEFTFTRAMSVADYAGLQATYSRLITASEAERAATLARMRAALDRLFPDGGVIEVPMRTRCWRADRAPRC
jgi:SAM-dependent methyltransferase